MRSERDARREFHRADARRRKAWRAFVRGRALWEAVEYADTVSRRKLRAWKEAYARQRKPVPSWLSAVASSV